MRLLLLTSEFLPLHGGIGTYARELARAACELGIDVTLCAPDYRDELDEGDLGPSDRAAFPFRVLRFPGGRHSFRDVPAKIRFLRTVLKAERYDVIHAADWPFFFPLAVLRHLHAGRSILTFHGTEIAEIDAGWKRLAIKLTKMFGGWADIVTNSAYTRQHFLEHFPKVDPGLAFVERLGVSDFWFATGDELNTVRLRLGIPAGRKILTTVARMTPRKGHLTVIDALGRLAPELRSQITYLVVGPTYDETYTDEVKTAAHNAACDVRLMGKLSDEAIRDLYRVADVFCLVGTYPLKGDFEGFGLVYLEAAAQGLPSVAANVGGVPDAILDGETGVLVPPQDPIALAAALQRLLCDDAHLDRLGKQALAWAKVNSWRRCAQATYLGERSGTGALTLQAQGKPTPRSVVSG